MWDDARVGFIRTDWKKQRAIFVEYIRMTDELFHGLEMLAQLKEPPDDPALKKRLDAIYEQWLAQMEKVRQLMG
jgi:hypothetical protein